MLQLVKLDNEVELVKQDLEVNLTCNIDDVFNVFNRGGKGTVTVQEF